jgi:hypothetical protein
MKYKKWLWVVSMVILSGCAANTPKPDPTAYTLTNLHPDPIKHKLYTVNYQLSSLIPRCTPVTILKMGNTAMTFKDSTGTIYSYELHSKSTPEGFTANRNKYFGASCDNAAINKLSTLDKKGIQEGKALIGMSKQGVLYAIGYPPEHMTPSTSTSEWRYWKNRFSTFIVYFNSAGKVDHIKG